MTQPDPLIGKAFGNYEILGELGRGGMGVVYMAHEKSLERSVALKVLPPEFGQDPESVKRFQREARAVAQLNHPNIVQIHAVGEQDGRHYLAMEYVKGKSVKDFIRENDRVQPRPALELVRQAALGLAEAHGKGIVHRDIKPRNILINESGLVKVLDFGLAKVAQASTGITATGATLGTPMYMSPEQIKGEQVDGRSDIFSLGIMLYELLSGKAPFAGDTPMALMYQIVERPLPDFDEGALFIPYGVKFILNKMTAKKPEDRYASAAALVAAIDAQLPSLPVARAETAKLGPAANLAPTLPAFEPLGRTPARFPVPTQPHEASWQSAVRPQAPPADEIWPIMLEETTSPSAPARRPASPANGMRPLLLQAWSRLPVWASLGVLAGVVAWVPYHHIKGVRAKQKASVPVTVAPPPIVTIAPVEAPVELKELHGAWYGRCASTAGCLLRFRGDGTAVTDDERPKTPLMTGNFKILRAPDGTIAVEIAAAADVMGIETPNACDVYGSTRQSSMRTLRNVRISDRTLTVNDEGTESVLQALPDGLGSVPESILSEADLGIPESQFALAEAYARGQGMPGSQTLAEKWYRLAAEQEHAKAQLRLGSLLAAKQGSGTNKDEAYNWLYLAAGQGETEARAVMATIEESMDAGEFEFAVRRAPGFADDLWGDVQARLPGKWCNRTTQWSYDFGADGTVTLENPRLSRRPVVGVYAVVGRDLRISGTLLVDDPQGKAPSQVGVTYWLNRMRFTPRDFRHVGMDNRIYAYRRDCQSDGPPCAAK
ncbi:MAG: protein kinase [Elusimicrobia bacterium]|nr:protein kinase [Elusimicrobiota bacterium]